MASDCLPKMAPSHSLPLRCHQPPGPEMLVLPKIEAEFDECAGHDILQKPKRMRTSKPKVKTGCSNCKQRRIKCDEKRPACTQCIRSKKTCTGYPPPSRSARPHEVVSIAPKPSQTTNVLVPAITPAPPQLAREIRLPPRRAQKIKQNTPSTISPDSTPEVLPVPIVTLYRPSISIPLQQHEGLYFQLFRTHTARELSGYFDSIFWTRTVLRECHSEPAIRHAVVALGALYKTLEKSSESPPTSPTERARRSVNDSMEHWQVAVRQYSDACNALVHVNGQASTSHRILLMASVLLACFDSFVGDHKQAIRQIQNGLGLLEKLRAEAKRASLTHCDVEPVEEELVQMFTRLAIQAKSYDMAFHFPQPYVIRLNVTPSPSDKPSSPSSDSTGSPPNINSHQPIVEAFQNVHEARLAWDKLCERIFRFTETLFAYQGGGSPMGVLPAGLKSYGAGFKQQLEAWALAFDHILESRTAPGVSFQEKAAISVLKMFQIMGHILFLMTFSNNESQFDAFEAQFKAIVELASEVVGDEERRAGAERCPDPHQCQHRYNVQDIFGGHAYAACHIKPSFSADLGIVPPLYVVATKCRDPIIRRQAIQLLRSSARREGMWDSQLTALIGQWVATIEEHGFNPSLWDQPSALLNRRVSAHPGSLYDSTRGQLGRGSVSGPKGGVSSSDIVTEDRRIMVRSVDFDLRARFARLSVGTRGLNQGSLDLRSQETQIRW